MNTNPKTEVTVQKHEDDENNNKINRSFLSRNWAVILVLSIIGFYLFTEHLAHVLGILPWLILLACPFIHIFMHRGHGGHDHSSLIHKENDNAKS